MRLKCCSQKWLAKTCLLKLCKFTLKSWFCVPFGLFNRSGFWIIACAVLKYLAICLDYLPDYEPWPTSHSCKLLLLVLNRLLKPVNYFCSVLVSAFWVVYLHLCLAISDTLTHIIWKAIVYKTSLHSTWIDALVT